MFIPPSNLILYRFRSRSWHGYSFSIMRAQSSLIKSLCWFKRLYGNYSFGFGGFHSIIKGGG